VEFKGIYALLSKNQLNWLFLKTFRNYREGTFDKYISHWKKVTNKEKKRSILPELSLSPVGSPGSSRKKFGSKTSALEPEYTQKSGLSTDRLVMDFKPLWLPSIQELVKSEQELMQN
jgi:hypothetical protein